MGRQKVPTGILTHPLCKTHEMGNWHPECPARLSAIQDQLIASGLAPFLEQIDAPQASLSAIVRAHDPEYVDHLRNRVPERGYFPLDPDTSMNPSSWKAALHAAGAVVEATDRVIGGALANAFCAVRPPGHHARPGTAMGFCLLNNVAIGALHALEVHGLERVAIVDFDVHHGNGTEEIFAGDENVIMVATFQYPLYPYSGVNPLGSNMHNVPLSPGSGGDAFRAAFVTRCLPALEAHRPEIIFVSAGFDAHLEDPLANLELTDADFEWVSAEIVKVAARHAQGRIVS